MDGLVAGRIVYFVVDKFSTQDIARSRVGGGGNALQEGDIVPAMVVKVWDASLGYVNLKVMLDGPDTYWATSVNFSEPILNTQLTPEHAPGLVYKPRTWHWMYSGQATRGNAK